MTTTTATRSRFVACAERLGVDLATAHAICDRDVATCEAVVAHLSDAFHAGCCAQAADHDNSLACEHLRRLWDAQSYLALASAGAPTSGAFPCSCGGSGKFYSGGMVLNGTFTGTIGTCFRCEGKGWQSDADRKRNAYYDNHVRRISL